MNTLYRPYSPVVPGSGWASAPWGDGRSAEAAPPSRARAEREEGRGSSSSRHFPAVALPPDSSWLGTETEAASLHGRSFTSRYPPGRGAEEQGEEQRGEEQRSREVRSRERRSREVRSGEVSLVPHPINNQR